MRPASVGFLQGTRAVAKDKKDKKGKKERPGTPGRYRENLAAQELDAEMSDALTGSAADNSDDTDDGSDTGNPSSNHY